MKTKYFLMAGLFLFTGVKANAQSYEQGNTIVSVGYGFGNLSKALFKALEGETGYKYKSFGPMYLGVEYVISDKIGLGLSVNYVSANVSWTGSDSFGTGNYTYNYKWNAISALLRTNFHFGESDIFDPYLGVGIGYRKSSFKYSDNDPNYDDDLSFKSFNPLGFETVLGVRFYPTDMVNIFTEVGIAKAPIKFGVGIKI